MNELQVKDQHIVMAKISSSFYCNNSQRQTTLCCQRKIVFLSFTSDFYTSQAHNRSILLSVVCMQKKDITWEDCITFQQNKQVVLLLKMYSAIKKTTAIEI